MEHYNSTKAAEDYHRVFTKDDDNPELKRKAIQRYVKFTSKLKQGGHVLDAGCGTGIFVPYFVKNGFTVTGVDSSSSMIELASENNPLAEFKVMDIRHLNFPSNYFDGIWNVATLLHMGESDVKLALQESRRVLKDNGTLYIATRTKDTSISIIEESREGGEIMVNYYSVSKLDGLLKASGFETIEIKVEPDDYSRPFDCVFFLVKLST